MRIFIAINLSHILREKLGLLTEKLKVELGQKHIRWVKPGGMHLTLKFIGETPSEQVDGIMNTIAEIAKKTNRFEMHVSGLGCLPDCDRPRVISIDLVEPSGELRILHKRLEAELIKVGIKSDRREFHPHLTLGRIRRGTSLIALKSLGQEIRSRDAIDLGVEAVKKFSLIKSELRPSGPVYSVLSSHALENVKI
ncbi:MAG: RNA 2',3'-cyclic phosphodiesterase [Chloroflexi bacterium]|nr:RNA 2',3'-cyclic phosphodiesterase [Chloroflexota bacterium]